MKEILIARGKSIALIDDEDFDLVSKYKWTRAITKMNKIYARSLGPEKVLMHRLLMPCESHLVIDHKNHNGLDNRKCNLRIATRKQNVANKRSARNSSSKYLGVSKRGNKFTAQIGIGNKKTIKIGFFDNEVDAALAYNEKAKIVHGEFANLNVIQ